MSHFGQQCTCYTTNESDQQHTCYTACEFGQQRTCYTAYEFCQRRTCYTLCESGQHSIYYIMYEFGQPCTWQTSQCQRQSWLLHEDRMQGDTRSTAALHKSSKMEGLQVCTLKLMLAMIYIQVRHKMLDIFICSICNSTLTTQSVAVG